MFGAKKDENGTSTKPIGVTGNATHGLNSLVHGTSVTGSLSAESDFRIDGKLKGDLACESKVIIGSSGLVEGEVSCQNALIEGKFEGTLIVREMLQIKANADVRGDITCGKLEVDAGAAINGTCTMNN